jgi:replicative DNA helicase
LDTNGERYRPHNIESEISVLGAVLLNNSAIDDVMAVLRPGDFFRGENRKIYSCMSELSQENKPIDLTTLVDRLQTKGWLGEVGGIMYLTKLAGAVPTAANVAHYISIVQEHSIQRQLIEAAEEIAGAAANATAAEAIDLAQAKIDSLQSSTERKDARHIRDVLIDCFGDIEHKYATRDGTGITGCPSGYADLDRMTGGWQMSDLIIVGARPSVGKTAFALNMAENAAEESGKTIGIFSIEMSEKQLGNRMLSARAHIDGHKIRSGYLIDDDWEKLTMAIGSLSNLNILIDDTPGIRLNELRSKARKWAREHDLGLILIDYLQLIEVLSRQGVNRQQEISEISRSLKQLARELQVPVIALSQLSRGVEQRQDKRPMMSDLRESGAIEQDADIVAFLYRDDYYDKETEKKNIIEIIIAKQRNGPVGTVELVFLKEISKFVSMDRSHADPDGLPPVPPDDKGFRKPDMYRAV